MTLECIQFDSIIKFHVIHIIVTEILKPCFKAKSQSFTLYTLMGLKKKVFCVFSKLFEMIIFCFMQLPRIASRHVTRHLVLKRSYEYSVVLIKKSINCILNLRQLMYKRDSSLVAAKCACFLYMLQTNPQLESSRN